VSSADFRGYGKVVTNELLPENIILKRTQKEGVERKRVGWGEESEKIKERALWMEKEPGGCPI